MENNLHTDYLAEFLAALMIENGISPDRIRIVRTGGTRAKTAKDIESIKKKYTPDTLAEEYIEIKVNREGLFDILPENLFFDYQRSLNAPADTKQILSEMDDNREEEKEIRCVFSLFENEIDSMRIQLHLWEHQFHKSNRYRNFVNLFARQYPVIKLLEPEEGWLFIHILLRIHHIRGNNGDIEQALAYILKLPVKLIPVKLKDAPQQSLHADACQLDDCFIDNDYFVCDQEDYILQVNDIPPERVKEFLPGGKCVELLDESIKMLFQADIRVEKHFNATPPDNPFSIDGNEKTGAFTDINAFL